ncbi:MAG: ATPase, T2SS/T4P/T4SS family [Thermoanaerobaculia bacterium]|nr:ATPase, T2SS/T4P/T4SS family [Thermoanaerobaculia bacterium]
MTVTSSESRLQRELSYRRELEELTHRIHSAESISDILVNLTDRIRKLLACEALTVYAVDVEKQELYSIYKVANAKQVVRVPKDPKSIAGYCALSRETVTIEDAYDEEELRTIHPKLEFDESWDQAFGFRTREVLAVPLLMEKYLLGVLQLINKREGDGFTEADREAAEEIGRTLAVAFYNQNRAARATPAAAAEGKRHKFSGLVDRGLVSEADVAAAVTYARNNRKDPARVLMEQHRVPREEIGRSLSDFYGLPFYADDGVQTVPEDLRERVPDEFWRKNLCAPLSKRGGTLFVAAEDPFDLEKIDAIKSTGIAANIEIQVALADDIQAYLDRSFGKERPAPIVEDDDRESFVELLEAAGEDEEESEELEAAADGFIVRLANRIIIDGIKAGASDIHIEPNGEEDPLLVRFRRDGECYNYQEVPGEHRAALVSRLKILAQLDISEKRKPQDGKIRFRKGDGEITELRVATMPTAGEGNEDVVMRILAASKPIPIDRLGMSEQNLEAFKEIASKPYGLVLCVGPTGSGKTTTLHSALGYINTESVKIWTAEDPVEITQRGLRQVQVKPKIGFDFAAAMRSFLRADPDIIMLGEMRDEETAGTGIEASLTGHLVLSTLHTNSAPETVTRLLDMGLDPFNFADALLGILAQRLVRTLCPECREEYRPGKEEIQELREAYLRDWPEGQPPDLDLSSVDSLHRAPGCDHCQGSGYRGRMAIHELLVATDPIQQLIVQRQPVEKIRDLAIEEGMRTLLQDGVWKVTEGHTDLKQVKAVCIR